MYMAYDSDCWDDHKAFGCFCRQCTIITLCCDIAISVW